MSATLESLPGVGPGLAAAIRRQFGDDARFLRAAKEGDLESLEAVDGISARRAMELVRAVRGESDEQVFLATPAARAIHQRLLQLIQDRAGTKHGRNRLRLLDFLHDAGAAQQRMEHVLDVAGQVAHLDAHDVRRQLRRLRPLQEPQPRCDTTRLVVAEHDEIHERLHAMGLGQWNILGSRRDLAMAGDMELVVVAYDEGVDTDGLDAVEEIPGDAPLCDLNPAAVLAWADANRTVIEACHHLALILGRDSVAQAILDARDGVEIPKVDAHGLAKVADRIRNDAATAIDGRIGDLQLSGTELLAAMRGGDLPAAVQTVVDDEVRQAHAALKDATGLDVDLLPRRLPLEIDEEELERAERRIGAEGRLQRERSERTAARAIAKLQDALAAEVAHWLEWDADFALGCFAHDHRLRAWTPGDALRIDDGIHIDLARDPDAQRVHYAVGGDAPVALLTGANSGGKSTLLEMVCQTVILARMGLPVAGEARVPWLDEVHLVTARKGLDAGAFETFLRSFMPASIGGAKRLVLADEVESVTELQAAGAILAFFIERLLETDSLGIIVSHVPDAITDRLPEGAIRIDGIEAKGLDEQHRLVVDRQPVFGRKARSTPELIVQRLAAATRGAEGALYAALAERLQRVNG